MDKQLNPNSRKLLEAAIKAREKAKAPYSNFKVGAALETKTGKIYTGCNIENVSFGLTMCAERVALFKAISEGETEFSAIAIVADGNNLITPCGSCRQLIWEFCGDIKVIVANLSNNFALYKIAKLLPIPFDSTYLNSELH